MMFDEAEDDFVSNRRQYSLQGYLDQDRPDSEEEDMMHQIDQESDGEDEMRDSEDDDEELSNQYSNFFKMRIGKEKDQYSSIRKRLEKSGMQLSGNFLKPKKKIQQKA